ncbi:MAG: hypothetical protein FJY79_07875 [Candidatus Aminicenantes bacterium]|nr:hypothetical protein [Candidatus Aminicenantes bacterium]
MTEKGVRPGRAAAAIAAAALVFAAVERIFLHDGEYHHWWDGIPLFYGLFGGLGALTLIFAAKSLVMRLIKRKESYYDRD